MQSASNESTVIMDVDMDIQAREILGSEDTEGLKKAAYPEEDMALQQYQARNPRTDTKVDDNGAPSSSPNDTEVDVNLTHPIVPVKNWNAEEDGNLAPSSSLNDSRKMIEALGRFKAWADNESRNRFFALVIKKTKLAQEKFLCRPSHNGEGGEYLHEVRSKYWPWGDRNSREILYELVWAEVDALVDSMARKLKFTYRNVEKGILKITAQFDVKEMPWSDNFISSRGNEYFCEIDEEYLTDRFNLTGLNAEVQYYQYALDLVTDVFDVDCDDEMREQIEKSARHLYGLVHARYITTTRGLSKMLDKYKKGEFGKCPRVHCSTTHLLPTGLSDVAGVQHVKLFCPKCEDVYSPKSSKHATVDGAYFGTSFPNILFQVYPALVPEKSTARYELKIFGFKVHAAAALQRWQDTRREEMVARLKAARMEKIFADEDQEAEEEDDENEEGMDVGGDL